MTILIENKALTPAVFLAPLAGITDLPFRKLVSSFGAGLVVSEMIGSQEMVQARPSARAKAELGLGIENTAVQIAGRDAYWMAECAKMCADMGAQIIDINMGCPAKTVTNGLSGSALMKTPDIALSLIDAVVSAVDVPVTLKTRLGWDEHTLNAADLAKRAVEIGVQMITIHGRTRCQFYKGHADWRAINDVVQAVDVPVIANGDIIDADTAAEALNLSKANGVMIGRGARGKPWLLAQVAHQIFGNDKPITPQGKEFIDLISNHYQSILMFYGTELGNKVARKHIGWYLDNINVPSDLRRAIMTNKNSDHVLALIDSIGSDARVAA